MIKEEQFTVVLKKYVPEKAAKLLATHLVERRVWLRITNPRNTKLGDYKPPIKTENHKISINNNLNPYSFLLTMVHELAHLETFEQFGVNVKPHGQEWKNMFAKLMLPYFEIVDFPLDIKAALNQYFANPKAATCNDLNLSRALKKYNNPQYEKSQFTAPSSTIFVEDVKVGERFLFNENRVFLKQKLRRKRYFCEEESTGRIYLFHPLTEVLKIN